MLDFMSLKKNGLSFRFQLGTNSLKNMFYRDKKSLGK